jgi:hypothetical protein
MPFSLISEKIPGSDFNFADKAVNIKVLIPGFSKKIGFYLKNLATTRRENMAQEKRFINFLTVMGVAAMLMMPFATADNAALAAAAPTRNLNPGSSWVVDETTSLAGLTIAGGTIKAREGYSLTMTVDGVETAIKPGAYKGDIVLTLTRIAVKKDPSHNSQYNLRTGIYLENGKYVVEKSVAAAVVGGKVTDNSVKDVRITSVGEEFNGIIATGDFRASYSISNPVINLTGNGANDFAGIGAAIMSDGNADVTVNKASIITNGCARSAIFVGGTSTMHVNDSNIEVGSPALPEGYKDVFTEGGKYFFRVPFMLGLAGTCRATNIVDKVKEVTYTNSRIKAQGWGAMSIDGGDNTKLTMTKCIIETVESGYGAYAIGGSVDKFSGCTFNVADMAMIGTGGSGVFTDGTVVNSRRFGVMFHGSGDLTIDKATVFNTRSTAIQVKSPSHNIVVDNAQLNAENGIIIQLMPNDDPNARSSSRAGAEGARGGDAPAAGARGEAPSPEGPEGTSVPTVLSSDVNATFRNVTLKGDIINGNTAAVPLNVALEKAIITGAITTATVTMALGPNGEEITMKTPQLYKLIGEVSNTYCATDDKYGIAVSLDAGSKWVVDETSYLTGLAVAEGGTISAPAGSSVTMMVDGVKKPITAGTYKGKIVLTVTKN